MRLYECDFWFWQLENYTELNALSADYQHSPESPQQKLSSIPKEWD
jgi:hypothetical protein